MCVTSLQTETLARISRKLFSQFVPNRNQRFQMVARIRFTHSCPSVEKLRFSTKSQNLTTFHFAPSVEN